MFARVRDASLLRKSVTFVEKNYIRFASTQTLDDFLQSTKRKEWSNCIKHFLP